MDAGVLTAVLERSAAQSSILNGRLASLRVLQRYWSRADVKGMLAQMARMADRAVTADVLRAGALKSFAFDLEAVVIILPLLAPLLNSREVEHVLAALEALTRIVDTFGELVGASCGATETVGVDLAAEARRQRCRGCYEALRGMQPSIEALAQGGDARTQRPAAQILSNLKEHQIVGLSPPAAMS